MTTVVRYRAAVVLLTAALLATLTFALTGGSRADALDGPVDVVYVATGQNFPDALAGSTLAVAGNAPLLTVAKDLPLPQATITALEALDPGRIVVFGGPAAVSDAVVGALTTFARTGSVTRISGTDRHATAAAIADALPAQVGDADHLDGLDSTAFLRSDATAADANQLGGQAATSYARSAPSVVHGYLAGKLVPVGEGGTLGGVELLTLDVTTPDECGDASTRHTYLVSYTGTVNGQLGVTSEDGTNAHAYTSITMDHAGLQLDEGFQHVWVEGSTSAVESSTIAITRVLEDVAPGTHTFRARTYTTSTSDFDLRHEHGTAIVQDVGFVCA